MYHLVKLLIFLIPCVSGGRGFELTVVCPKLSDKQGAVIVDSKPRRDLTEAKICDNVAEPGRGPPGQAVCWSA